MSNYNLNNNNGAIQHFDGVIEHPLKIDDTITQECSILSVLSLPPGKYKIEIWGAQGSNAGYTTDYPNGIPNTGGKGGYTYGVYTQHKAPTYGGNKLVVCCGGYARTYTGSTSYPSYEVSSTGINRFSYNGGTSFTSHEDARNGGGGCTHVIMMPSEASETAYLKELSYLSLFQDQVLLVAGGGAGYRQYNYNLDSVPTPSGGGGGYELPGASSQNKTATSTSGYAFGKAQPYPDSISITSSGAGGGYYGGYVGTATSAGSSSGSLLSPTGGGGSAYINEKYITNAGGIAGVHYGGGALRITVLSLIDTEGYLISGYEYNEQGKLYITAPGEVTTLKYINSMTLDDLLNNCIPMKSETLVLPYQNPINGNQGNLDLQNDFPNNFYANFIINSVAATSDRFLKIENCYILSTEPNKQSIYVDLEKTIGVIRSKKPFDIQANTTYTWWLESEEEINITEYNLGFYDNGQYYIIVNSSLSENKKDNVFDSSNDKIQIGIKKSFTPTVSHSNVYPTIYLINDGYDKNLKLNLWVSYQQPSSYLEEKDITIKQYTNRFELEFVEAGNYIVKQYGEKI